MNRPRTTSRPMVPWSRVLGRAPRAGGVSPAARLMALVLLVAVAAGRSPAQTPAPSPMQTPAQTPVQTPAQTPVRLPMPPLSPGKTPAPTPSPADATARPQIVATTTIIGSAVAELVAGWADLAVILPPAADPGRFTLEAAQKEAVKRAALVLQHDFEIFYDARLLEGGMGPKKLLTVSSEGNQIQPDSYLALLAQVSEMLCVYFPDHAASIRRHYADASARIRRLAARERTRIRPRLEGKSLMCASSNSGLLEWAGARVPFTFGQNQSFSSDQLRELAVTVVDEHVVGVVGNINWGEDQIRPLADSLDLPGVNLSSFPGAAVPQAYDRLLKSNVDRLLTLTGPGKP